ncbi:nuclear transport factor 2 family protein [Spirosoma sp. KNUC1025]|uniref:nuclear transport factor 2 family protein n=1 Tax=Spirosoma sp. KNUC1025 TaxID=2894082 RepID=UPI003869C5BD|nr:nuclear transport factor 2 family protein [Spirosoma sp. KNUC1025]
MKTQSFTFLLLFVSVVAAAQTKLADEFPAMVKARNADALGYLRAHTTPDMVFVAGHDGSVHNKEWLMNLLTGQKSHTVDISDLKIQQVNDLAVATGISALTAVSKEGKTGYYKDAFTYTLRWIDGQWMLTNIHHTKIDYK